ncbi:MAG TPA: DUF3108 domain-containing protein [Bryobacteraceae bacterium]|nr:DUF3108 domain-containing protein [Bryobacteraceae bacterium]
MFTDSIYILLILGAGLAVPAAGPATAPAHGPAAATAPSLTGFPFTNETLRYAVSWPTGMSLGEAHMGAARSKAANGAGERWTFEFALDAPVPGFAVEDRYHASASLDLCSATFEKETAHGSHKTHERIEFDDRAGVARRETLGAGKSEVPISQCGRDALTFLYFARRELGQGRVPPQEDVILGAKYNARLEYTGEQTIKVGGKPAVTDRVIATLRGPASEISFEMFFARDPARTPLLIRVPLSLGVFSMELSH